MNLQEHIPLSNYSTFRIGGNAQYFIKVKTKQELKEATEFAKEKNIPILLLGGGSNIIFPDTELKKVVIKIENTERETGNWKLETRDKNLNSHEFFTVGAGLSNIELYRYAKNLGYDFSPLYTVPGTIGGALSGNAGVPDGEIKDFLVEAEVFHISPFNKLIPDSDRGEGLGDFGEFQTKPADFFKLSYRHSIFHEKPELREKIIIWNITLKLPKEDPKIIEKKAKDFLAIRKKRQPWGKTGGSFFKNPTEGAAGYFLEQAGLKGKKIGGAFFSEKHANFLMNDGTATQKDVLELRDFAQKIVKEKFGVKLETEVRIIL